MASRILSRLLNHTHTIGNGNGLLQHWSRPLSILYPPGVDPASTTPTRTVAEVVNNLTQCVIGGPVTYNPEKFKRQREALMDQLPSSQDELPARRMMDSFDEAVIPLGSDLQLRDRYLTHFGGVRVGRLLEDMDVFAVHLVFNHMLNPKSDPDNPQSPFSIVTALVDRLDIKAKLCANEDVKIMGHVTWVGKSSAESTLELYQFRDGRWVHVTEASFVLVVRDANTKGSSFVNPLVAETAEERLLLERGERNKIERLAIATDSLFKNPPSEEEKSLVHEFFIQTVDHSALSFKARCKPDGSQWMEDAKLKNIIICQPENRNRFNKIFGGFIMRQAFELAFANAFVYSKTRPYVEHMDDISFKKPVDVGSLLYLNSQVCYTEADKLQVRVSAEVLDPETGELSLTNVFQYTFGVRGVDSRVPMVIPKTYHEAMMWLEGRRHYLNSVRDEA